MVSPVSHHRRIFHAPDRNKEYALFREGSFEILLPRDDVLRRAQEDPDAVRWYSPRSIRVVFPDGKREILSVLVCRRASSGEPDFRPKSFNIAIRRFAKIRTRHIGGRGRLACGGDWRRNSVDDLVDALVGSDPVFSDNFERAWRGQLKVTHEELPEDSGRAILYFPWAGVTPEIRAAHGPNGRITRRRDAEVQRCTSENE